MKNHNQGVMQPFGYTGYQMDTIAGTYYAQAREYVPGVGRFDGEYFIRGFHEIPQTINHYKYCLNNPHKYIDLNGLFLIGAIAAVALVGAGISAAVNAVGQFSKDSSCRPPLGTN